MKKIEVTTKKEFEAVKKMYRNNGFNFVTFGKKFAEMESTNGQMVIIEIIK